MTTLKRTGNFNIDKMVTLFKLSKAKLPVIIANDAKNHFVKGFEQDGGQTDKGKWDPRKKDPKGGRRGILIGRKGGTLWKHIKVVSSSWDVMKIAAVGIIYAERHNEGLAGMPQREFLGNSKVLNKDIEKTLTKEIAKMFKKSVR